MDGHYPGSPASNRLTLRPDAGYTLSMTQTESSRIEYSQVRPGMTVQTYSGRPIEVTEVRHVVRKLGEGRGWTATVELSGWLRDWSGGQYVEHCYQLPNRSTRVERDAADAKHARFWASVDDDAAMHRTIHDYSRRFVMLDLNIRI